MNDIIADESFDKKRQPLLKLSISGRHRGHYLWLLTQSYSAVSKNLRRQVRAIFTWYLKWDLRTIHDENAVLTDDELVVVRGILRKSKHTCLYVRNEHPLRFKLLNHTWYSNETHLMLSSYPKTFDVIEMVGVPNWGHVTGKFLLGICHMVSFSIYCGNLGTRWIQSFSHQQTWLVLQ